MLSARVTRLVVAVLYAAVAVLLPALHQRQHAAGIAHRHDGLPTHAHGSDAGHLDLELLGLHDVAEAGVAVVDCELAELTLISCSDGAPSFAQLASSEPPDPPDPEHGRGSAAHLNAFLVATLVVVFDAPRLEPAPPAAALPALTLPCTPRLPALARGPPAILA